MKSTGERVAELVEKLNKPTKRVKNGELYNSKFTRTEIALLIKYLNGNGVFKKEITNALLTEHFEELTGYSGEQIRQTMSKKEELTRKENYDKLLELFRNIIKEVEEDMRKL